MTTVGITWVSLISIRKETLTVANFIPSEALKGGVKSYGRSLLRLALSK